MKSFKIFDLVLNDLSENEFENIILDAVGTHKKLQIATVNNEFILETRKNQKFYTILKDCFCTIDSTGVAWAIDRVYKTKVNRLAGADLFWSLCELANKRKWGIFLLGGQSGVGQSAKIKILRKLPKIRKIEFTDGITISPEKSPGELIEKINTAKPEIIFVALGAPKQEIWIRNNLQYIKSHIFIGIGGTLDFVSGKVPRAPIYFRRLKLEWLFRLFVEPKRVKRIFNAVVVFPFIVLFGRN